MSLYPFGSPEPAPKSQITAAQLQEDLLRAVLADDVNDVRRVLDTAFWQKLPKVKPDGFHLLVAAEQDNRAMVQLLTTHGATWTADEAKVARHCLNETKQKHLAAVFKNARIQTDFNQAAPRLKDFDIITALRWAQQAQHAIKNYPALVKKDVFLSMLLQETQRLSLSPEQLLNCDKETLAVLLHYRDPKRGDGTPQNPLDVTANFHVLLTIEGKQAALFFLDGLKDRGLFLKPIQAEDLPLWRHLDVVADLSARGMLAAENPRRLDIIDSWGFLQKKVTMPVSDYTIRHDQAYIDTQHAAYIKAARVLFGKDKPLSVAETNRFVRMHELRGAIMPQGLAQMDAALIEMDFFTGKNWTPVHLRQLAFALKHETQISETFKKMAAVKEFTAVPFETYLNKKHFSALQTALETGGVVPNAAQTVQILRYLKAQLSKDIVTPEIKKTVQALYDIGADFSAVQTEEFLGDRDPALAKTFLDVGIATAENFDVQQVAARMGGRLKLITPWGEKNHAYTEFTCQLLLEIAVPEKTDARRSQKPKSYQRHFVEEWAQNPALNIGAIRYEKKPLGKIEKKPETNKSAPPPPPPSRRLRF